MAIDLDHFVAAKSLRLKDALSLTARPPLHSTTFVLATALSVWLLSYVFYDKPLKKLSLILAVAWLSHHARDGTRRGLWFQPFGSTPSLPMWLYMGTVSILPLISISILHYQQQKNDVFIV
ncbi:hypothetical protein ScPMuIL_003369 [Solemya velum]